MKALFAALALVWLGTEARAYPEFIGYGYGACITCHYNGLGNGALNDYGRGVWASEIAGNPFKAKLEDLSVRSGFLGSRELPYWLRPHIKYRGLNLQTNPGSSTSTTKFIPMQVDLGAALSLDQEQKYLIMLGYGYVPRNSTIEAERRKVRLIAREVYLRVQATEKIWLYAGKMDKAYGIRTVDHTAYNRAPLELTMNAQSHGATVQYLGEKSDFALNYFNGNMDAEDQKAEQKGVAGTFETELIDRGRFGLSALQSKAEDNRAVMALGGHWRQGLSLGTAILFEYGIVQKKQGEAATNGSYTFLETMIRLGRGSHFLTNIERFNRDVDLANPDTWKVGFGFLLFPIQRFELRLHAIHQRDVSAEIVTPDQWQIQGQIHVSL